jgi:phytoene dehydrogenase-like protein
VVLGTAHPDGTNCLICYDPAQTAASFARHDAADGETVFGIQNRVLEKMVEMNELAFFSPHPDTGKFEQILKLCGYVMGRDVDEMSTMTAYELIERTFRSDKARQTLICPVALHLQGAPLSRGQGAFAVALSLFYTTAIGIGGNEALVDALSRCFLDHGGTILVNCPARSIEVRDGRASAVIWMRARFSLARASRPAGQSSPTPAPARRLSWSARRCCPRSMPGLRRR